MNQFTAILTLASMLFYTTPSGEGRYKDLQAVSVLVDLDYASGTGILVTREVAPDVFRTFVWTAGHCAEVLKELDGTYRNAVIYQEYRYKGKIIGTSAVEAKVVAAGRSYDDLSLSGQTDLALLEILQDNYRPTVVSATFYLEDTIPSIGTEVVHVGCTLGYYNSVSIGIISQTDVEDAGSRYDQTTVMAYPGSSGGGIFLESNQLCIGLLVRGQGPGLNFIVPVRQMKTWAKEHLVEWALYPSIPYPCEELFDDDFHSEAQ